MVGIYRITNLINGKVYIGSSSSIEDRKEYHFRFGKTYDQNRQNQLYNDMYKYGEQNFIFEVLEECDISQLEEKEQAEINKYPREKLYNTYTQIWKNQRGEKSSRAKLTEKQILEIYEILRENKISDRQIAKMYNICFNAISEINNGITYRHEGINYPIRIFKQKSTNRFFSDDEVRALRKEYETQNATIKDIYDKYKPKISYSAFRQMILRKTYKEID